MNIQQMHESFRVIGQQMGMQLVRGILPESIDVYLNNVIIEKTQLDLLNNVKTVLQDNVNMQGSTMSPINLFRNLYRTARFKIYDSGDEPVIEGDYEFCNILSARNANNGYHKIWLPTLKFKEYYDTLYDNNHILGTEEYFINPMLYLGFNVEYDENSQGNATACRLIGADMLETTFRDYCNAATKKNPVVTMVSSPIITNGLESTSGVANEYIEIYNNTKDCKVQYISIKYIKTPNVVKWHTDITKCVNCDLPEYTHFEIVERAVRKFFASVGMGGGDIRRNEKEN